LATIDEETPPSPFSIYAQMKFELEQFVTAECLKLGISHRIFRLGHIYGPHEELTYTRLLPAALKSIQRNEKMSISIPKNFSRQYIYTSDIVSEFFEYGAKNKHTLKNVVGRSISGEEIIHSLNLLSGEEIFSLRIGEQKDDYRASIRTLISNPVEDVSNKIQEEFISGLSNELNAMDNIPS
jgi:UDP-glucose 4-epimerase